jgi:nitroreductase
MSGGRCAVASQRLLGEGSTLFDVVDQRRSVRVFERDPIDERPLGRILRTANAAPSAGNLQSYEIYVVREKQLREQLAAAALSQDFLAAAPIVLVFCANRRRNSARYGERGRDLYAVQDATIACTFAMLAAAALGLATVWVGAFDEDDVRRIVGAPAHERPVAMLPIGLAAEAPERPPRRPLGDLVHEV